MASAEVSSGSKYRLGIFLQMGGLPMCCTYGFMEFRKNSEDPKLKMTRAILN